MFEGKCHTTSGILAIALIFLMAMPVASAGDGLVTGRREAGPRTITDDSSDLIVPQGESYELSGCHTYSNSVQINGTLKVKPYDGADITTGSLWLQARWILIGAGGTITADGRGYGGGGGASERSGAGGKGGAQGKGGDGDLATYSGGGGGGSNGGAGGSAGAAGTAGAPGTESGGGNGGDATKVNYKGGLGGTGFGGGGGGGAGGGGNTDPGRDGGGGGGGGTGGSPGIGFTTGGGGAGPFKGAGGTGQAVKGNDGGYAAAQSNGDSSTDMSILRGSGGGGGSAGDSNGGGGGGGAGGGSLALVSGGDITIGGTVSAAGGGGGAGGQDVSGVGGKGGGGAGGGILIFGQKVTVTGSIDARGRTGNTLATTNGGTVKIFFAVDQFSTANIQYGRKYYNGRPAMQGLVSPEDNSSATGKPEFSWKSALDPESETVSYQLQVSRTPDFKTLELDTPGITSTKHTPANVFTGTAFYWRVRARDDVGFGGWSATWRFITDANPPVSHMDQLPAYSISANFTVCWNGTDDSSGIGGYDIFATEDGGTFGIWQANNPKNTATYQGSDGHSYSFYCIAIDRGGNREAAKSVAEATTTVDATPPASKVAPMAIFQHGTSFKVSWSGSDAGSGVKSYDVFSSIDDGEFEKWQVATDKTSADFSGEDGHSYAFYSIATDNAGNVQETPGDQQMVRVKVDLTAPAVSAIVGDPNFATGPVFIAPTTAITLESEDGLSGVNATFFTIDGRPSKAYSGPVRESTPGHHNMTYWAVDKAGNKCDNGTLWFFVDNEAPVTSAAYDGPLVTAGGKVFISPLTAITLSASDAGCGLAKTEYKLDNAAYKAYTEPLKLATAGQHTILFRSVDKLGNSEAENTLKVTVDTAPPTTKATASDQLSKEDITVSLSATDADSGMCATYYRILKDKSTTGDFQGGAEVVIEAEAGGMADGNYTVQYYSTDMLGNKEGVKEVKVKIDTVVSLTVVKEKATVTKDSFTVEGKAEAGSKISVNGEQVTPSADGSFSAEVALKVGGNKITVQATDNAGNTASKTVVVTYDKPSSFIPGMLLPMAVVAFGLMLLAGWRKRK